ncbi:uncharacterized protein EDB91DRAFT_1325751 [Suillus paluster]|uniref:uncharacterized protein n=1 Tax=Suillus paluster TaxID=48578 RepID=UPI001B85FD42|nr:uncharacterized protein EDB91DRAFT_1325751 [Suillus paluster]KAG1756847.1 hypothetical protein EDB91DRAFT_1325751 [Suillus paluster]
MMDNRGNGISNTSHGVDRGCSAPGQDYQIISFKITLSTHYTKALGSQLTCHAMLSTRKGVIIWLFLERVLTAQTPLSSHASLGFYPHDLGQWDLHEAPAVNATGHLVFETANSLLQHWANTRHRIGHTIIPGTVPWVAMEPDHSMLLCHGDVKTGCWHATFTVTRPMKVLYFDGSSAAKLPEGTMDTQDLVAWSEMKPEWVDNEWLRIKDLCKWGQKYGVNGFVRMEGNVEIMVCDFTSHMEIISFLNLETLRASDGPVTDLPEDTDTLHAAFEVMHSASWHELYPGDTRVILDYSAFVSFYDTTLVPSLVPRRVGLERWDHRVAGISSEDIERVKNKLAEALVRPPATASGIDWKTVLRVVVGRYASRLEVMQYLLNITRQLRTVLTPYTILAALPSNTSVATNATNSWAAPVFRECATSHMAIAARGATLMPSEHLLLQAVQETTREICLDPFYPSDQRPEADRIRTLMGEWKEDMTKLISWLDWSVWVKCRPACGVEEMCYLPTWPLGFFPAPPEVVDEQRGAPFQIWDNALLWPDPNKGEWKRPQPKCIRRLEPYGF